MPQVTYNPTLSALEKALLNGTKNGIEQVRKFIQEMAFMTERYAKQLTPVDTGRLRSRIAVSMPLGAKGIRAEVGTNVFYAGYVHWGTYKMKGRPFMTEGKDLMLRKKTGEKIASRIDKEYAKAFKKL